MSIRKWGASFLKTGLPLEHITLMKFNSINWQCAPHWEYERENNDEQSKWFELDMLAYSPIDKSQHMIFLVECKYHDSSRFWFFLPCTTIDHTNQYGALEATDNLEINKRVFNSHPYEMLKEPESNSIFSLSKKSIWGVVASEDGLKQDNSIFTGLNQLAYGYVPFVLDRQYRLTTNWPCSVIPLLVTNAYLYRLRPEITDIKIIENASKPEDIADILDWTFCYYAPNKELLYRNLDLIDEFEKKYGLKKYKKIQNQLLELWTSPSWMIIANIDSLTQSVKHIYKHFCSLEKDFSYSKILSQIMEKRRNINKKST